MMNAGPTMDVKELANSFLCSSHNLFQHLEHLNLKLGAIDARLKAIETCPNTESLTVFGDELKSLKAFTQNVYQQLQSHHDYVHGEKMSKAVERIASETSSSKCLPEIWKLTSSTELLKKRIVHLEESQNAMSQPICQNASSPNVKNLSNLINDIENIVIRLAALGEQKVGHIEIVGDGGKRYSDGTSRRRMVTEEELLKGQHGKLTVPKAWKKDSDITTINDNFKQITRMMNDVILVRIDAVEKSMNERMDRVDKRVDILNSLFTTLNDHIKQQSYSPQTKDDKRKLSEHANDSEPETTEHVAEDKQAQPAEEQQELNLIENLNSGTVASKTLLHQKQPSNSTTTTTVSETESSEHISVPDRASGGGEDHKSSRPSTTTTTAAAADRTTGGSIDKPKNRQPSAAAARAAVDRFTRRSSGTQLSSTFN